jgi:hypothetical protein
MSTVAEKPVIGTLLCDGFSAIYAETLRNAECGKATDIAGLLGKLREQFLAAGYDYPLDSLMDVYECWSAAQRNEPCRD